MIGPAELNLMNEGTTLSSAIFQLLKPYPRGLTVTDISKKLGYNRNLTAKHLEVLTAEGKTEVRNVGQAKVYSVTQRVPLSAFLCFTKNMILIMDTAMTIVQTNDQYLKVTGYAKKDLIGKNLLEVLPPIISSPEALAVIQSTTSEQVIADIRHNCGRNELFYQMEVIPTTFEEGEKGLTIVLEDITERKRYVQNMEFLARTAVELVNLPADMDIFRYVADRVAELVPYPPQCFVESFDEVNRQFFCRAMVSHDFRERGAQIVGQDVVGMAFPIEEFFFKAPFFETIATFRPLREYHFKPFFEDEQYSMYEVCIRQIPKEICDDLVRKLGIGRMYLIGLVWQEQLFGIVGVFMSPEHELEDKQVFESFIRQASIALARRQTEDRLRRSEERFKSLVELAALPTAVVNREGQYLLMNREFTELFGYTFDEIPRGKEWFTRAFPDPARRKEAIVAWKNDVQADTFGRIMPRTFEVRCKSGENKTILFRPVTLSDGTHYITYEDCTVTS
jgi:PAS domain S-box-containing protein